VKREPEEEIHAGGSGSGCLGAVGKASELDQLGRRPQDVSKADGVTIRKRTYTVFNIVNIVGNRFRLIVQIVYESGTIFFKRILTHAEYDRADWKQNLLQEQEEQKK
jgi:mRNA-degrading endonuclease HigB of HigAB toxin-antitoxin module